MYLCVSVCDSSCTVNAYEKMQHNKITCFSLLYYCVHFKEALVGMENSKNTFKVHRSKEKNSKVVAFYSILPYSYVSWKLHHYFFYQTIRFIAFILLSAFCAFYDVACICAYITSLCLASSSIFF